MSWQERPDEARATGPEEPRHRSRKNRRQWCGGRVGRHHVPSEPHLSKEAASYHSTPRKHAPCFQAPWWTYKHPDGRWLCSHQITCTACGKVLRRMLEDTECPDYTPPRGATTDGDA